MILLLWQSRQKGPSLSDFQRSEAPPRWHTTVVLAPKDQVRGGHGVKLTTTRRTRTIPVSTLRVWVNIVVFVCVCVCVCEEGGGVLSRRGTKLAHGEEPSFIFTQRLLSVGFLAPRSRGHEAAGVQLWALECRGGVLKFRGPEDRGQRRRQHVGWDGGQQTARPGQTSRLRRQPGGFWVRPAAAERLWGHPGSGPAAVPLPRPGWVCPCVAHV